MNTDYTLLIHYHHYNPSFKRIHPHHSQVGMSQGRATNMENLGSHLNYPCQSRLDKIDGLVEVQLVDGVRSGVTVVRCGVSICTVRLHRRTY